jgi:hypothetical protein
MCPPQKSCARDRYAEGVGQQSPGSRSAPWERKSSEPVP